MRKSEFFNAIHRFRSVELRPTRPRQRPQSSARSTSPRSCAIRPTGFAVGLAQAPPAASRSCARGIRLDQLLVEPSPLIMRHTAMSPLITRHGALPAPPIERTLDHAPSGVRGFADLLSRKRGSRSPRPRPSPVQSVVSVEPSTIIVPCGLRASPAPSPRFALRHRQPPVDHARGIHPRSSRHAPSALHQRPQSTGRVCQPSRKPDR
jgi:hypothetical protein